MAMTGMTNEKLHKVLARAGLGSRRQIEHWISAGRVSVNGVTASVGQRVDQQSCIEVDGDRIALTHQPATRILMYHKQLGEVTTRADPQGRATVFDQLPPLRGRWVVVGRLDINTTGLLLFTNDGELAAKLMHPASGFEREYQVRIRGEPSAEQLQSLRTGVKLDGHTVRFNSITPLSHAGGSNRRFKVVVNEGRNREVRRLWESVGCQVNQLRRIRFGPISLPANLALGHWREIEDKAVQRLRARLMESATAASRPA